MEQSVEAVNVDFIGCMCRDPNVATQSIVITTFRVCVDHCMEHGTWAQQHGVS